METPGLGVMEVAFVEFCNDGEGDTALERPYSQMEYARTQADDADRTSSCSSDIGCIIDGEGATSPFPPVLDHGSTTEWT